MSVAETPLFTRLEQRARAIDSLICVGLDPHPEDVGGGGAGAALELCRRIMGQTAPFALAFKPNSAFFEALGPQGVAALHRVIEEASAIAPVILDAKRGDIASTAVAYARAAFDLAGADGLTVQPYLGWQALEPFLADPRRGVFVLCRTTNPGADARQEALLADGRPVYEAIAAEAAMHPSANRIGLVAGATSPRALARIRRANPRAWILVPGIGAQGGRVGEAVRAGLRADGLGMLVSASRSIARASCPGQAARALSDRVREARHRADETLDAGRSPPFEGRSDLDPMQAEIAAALLGTGCLRIGRFRLKSGLESPIYLDLRRLSGSPAAMRLVAHAYVGAMRGLTFDRVAALPYAGLPLAAAACLVGGWPMVYPRRAAKDHGRRQRIEGPFTTGERVVLLDDLATRGASMLEALPTLCSAGLHVEDAVVLVDRSSGAASRLGEHGVRLRSIVGLPELLRWWAAGGALTAAQLAAIDGFPANSGA